jgi:hypothetical protein
MVLVDQLEIVVPILRKSLESLFGLFTSRATTSNEVWSATDLEISTKVAFKSPTTLKNATVPRSAKALSPSNGHSG